MHERIGPTRRRARRAQASIILFRKMPTLESLKEIVRKYEHPNSHKDRNYKNPINCFLPEWQFLIYLTPGFSQTSFYIPLKGVFHFFHLKLTFLP